MSNYNDYEQVAKARIWLTINHPFFSTILLRRPMVVTEDLPTAATDGTKIMFNPKFMCEDLSQEECTGVLVHEVMHMVYKHHIRRGIRDPQLWNIAADYAINNALKAMGFQLPSAALIDAQYDDMTTEQIYEKLLENADQIRIQYGDNPDPGGTGGVLDAPDTSDAGRAAAEAQINRDIASAAEVAKGCGNMPGGLEGIINQALKPKVDWRSHLWSFVNQVTKDDYSFQRLNRHYMQNGICVPDLYSEGLGTIAVLVDTSGSVSQKELEQFCGEITGILDTYPCTIEAVYVDTQVNGHETFTREDSPIEMNIKGRGGTDFRPGFAWLEENVAEYACIIYLTDMECWSFPDPPHVPTLWVSTGPPGHGSEPPFGIATYMG